MSLLSHREEKETEPSEFPASTAVPLFQPSPSTVKKSSQPSKLVDLGAAAAFASQAPPTTTQQQSAAGGGGDLFGIFEGSSQPQQQTAQQGIVILSSQHLVLMDTQLEALCCREAVQVLETSSNS